MNNTSDDKRDFPRIEAKCPLLYLREQSPRQQVGIMQDFSATGLKMTCKEDMSVNEKISAELKPGSNKVIPAIKVEGIVVRCEPLETGEFSISCKLTHVDAPK